MVTEISILEFIHSETILHRDLKLENILMGVGDSYFKVHLIDFGLSKRYIDPQTEKHISMKAGKALMGSVEFASINNHTGKELSRRDDLESLGYILCNLLLGELPWTSLCNDAKMQENESKTVCLKNSFLESETFKQLPEEFKKFITAVRSMGFEEEPRYLEYRRDFKMLMIKEGHTFDLIYDWILLPVDQEVNNQIKALDDLIQFEDSLTGDEQEEIKGLMIKYSEDPTILDFKLDEIRKQNKKFDVISPNNSPGTSVVEDDKKGSRGKKGEVIGTGKKGTKIKGSKKDCTLI